jgi:two-component system response regulator NreC
MARTVDVTGHDASAGSQRAPRIRVLIVDHQTLLRVALRSLISRERDMEVVGDAADSQTMTTLAARVKPDVAIIDAGLAGAEGMASGAALRAASPDTRLIILGQSPDAAEVRAAVALGVTGYVVKDADPAELVAAIRAVHRGRLFVYLGAAGTGAGASLWGPAVPRGRRVGLVALSARERHVLVLVARGYTSRQIGQTLALSAKTVETYRARIGTKLGLHTRFELVRFALESGLLKAGENGESVREPASPARGAGPVARAEEERS